MLRASILTLATLCAAITPSPAAEPGKRIRDGVKWLCYYGDDRRVLDLQGYELFILESEALGFVFPDDRRGRLVLGYMSVGEADTKRWHWSEIGSRDWVLSANPAWPDSRLVDPRSPEWRALILDVIAPEILAAGYDGFLLDNVDTAERLLALDSDLYAGADTAMADLIRELRRRFPDAAIVVNGGLSIVPQVAGSIDALMYEGTVSTWRDDGNGKYAFQRRTPEDRRWLRPRLLRVRAAGLPVLAMEYADPDDPAAVEAIRAEAAGEGYTPYVSLPALDVFPGSGALPPATD